MAFTLHIDTSNAVFYDESDGDAYDPGPELARILRGVADQVDEEFTSGYLRDVNGNAVGHWEITEETEA